MKKNSKKNVSIQDQVTGAIASIHQMGNSLPLDEATPDGMKVSRIGNRVSLDAMMLAVTILEQHANRFPDYDLPVIQGAVEYEQAMAPLAKVVGLLDGRIHRSIFKRRANAAKQTLALYQSMKGFARLGKADESLVVAFQEMEKLLTTNRKRRATSVTQKEMEETKRQKRARKIVAEKLAVATAANDAASAVARAAGIDAPVTPALVPGVPGAVSH